MGGFAQQIDSTGRFVIARKQSITLCDFIPDSRCIGQNFSAAFQGLFLASRQPGVFDLLYLIAQQIDFSLLFGLVGDHGIQFPLDAHKLPVQHIVFLKFRVVLCIIIQNPQMPCRVQKSHGVVLTVNVDKSAAQLPQDGRGRGHAVDAAGALALGGDLTAEHQRIRTFVPRLLQTVQHGIRHLFKGSTDDGLGCARAHKVF